MSRKDKDKDKKGKIKIPKSVMDLRISPKKFAKKNNIDIKGKGLSKKSKKRNIKRLREKYSESAIIGLNKAVKILSENSGEGKKILKVKDGVENIISNPEIMKRVAKIYGKNPDNYPNLIFLPHMIMNTIVYYSQDDLSEEEKAVGESLDKDGLIKFCEKILKSQIKRYGKLGMSRDVSYQLASVVPTTKVLKNNRQWYKKLIQSLYMISEHENLDVDSVLMAVSKVDKKKSIDKKDFLEGFFSEFILTKSSNKNHSFTDTQKELHETLIERTLEYLDRIKSRRTRDILKTYIKRRKTAESYKNDTKRVIKFIDHAHSSSSYTNIKSVVQELISDNSTNELYLS